MNSAPYPAAIVVSKDDRFATIEQFADKPASYWRSIAEPAYRGDRLTLELVPSASSASDAHGLRDRKGTWRRGRDVGMSAASEWRAERDAAERLRLPASGATRPKLPRPSQRFDARPSRPNEGAFVETPTDAKPNTPRFALLAFDKIKPDEGAQYLIKGLLPRVGVAVVWGPPKCGKSFWTFDAVMHVALGWKYRGHRVAPGPVVYCALEGVHGFKNRVEAFRLTKLSQADGGSPTFYLMPASLSLVADHGRLIADIRRSFATPYPLPFVSTRSIARSRAQKAPTRTWALTSGPPTPSATLSTASSSSSITAATTASGRADIRRSIGALDVQIAVRRDAGNIVAELELSKDGEVGLQFVSRLVPVPIGVDQDGDAITSCVVEEVTGAVVSAKKSGKTRAPPKSNQTALRALRKAIEEVGEQAPASNTIPASARVVSVDTWRTFAYQAGISDTDNDNARRVAFSRAHRTLVDGNHVQAWGEYRWLSE